MRAHAVPGKGSNRGGGPDGKHPYLGFRRIVVAFDEETFAQVRKRAVSEKTSFAEQVRTLVEWGLLEADPL